MDLQFPASQYGGVLLFLVQYNQLNKNSQDVKNKQQQGYALEKKTSLKCDPNLQNVLSNYVYETIFVTILIQ